MYVRSPEDLTATNLLGSLLSKKLELRTTSFAVVFKVPYGYEIRILCVTGSYD